MATEAMSETSRESCLCSRTKTTSIICPYYRSRSMRERGDECFLTGLGVQMFAKMGCNIRTDACLARFGPTITLHLQINGSANVGEPVDDEI